MYPVTINLHIKSAAEMVACMTALSQVGLQDTPVKTEAPVKAVAEKAKAAPAVEKKAEAKAEETKPEAAKVEAAKPEVKTEEAAPTELAAEAIPYATVSKTITDGVKTKGRTAVVETLTSFGAAKGDQLKVEQYAAFIAAVDALPELVGA